MKTIAGFAYGESAMAFFYENLIANVAGLIAAFFLWLFGFFCGLRGERLPGEGWLSFLAKKKVTKESCLEAGADQS